ncbi:MAG: hypothetical protein ACRYG4_27910 [Janthinobacterium lividum]
MMAVALSVAVFAALALIVVGIRRLLRGPGERLRAGLMVGAGVVLLINVWLAAPLSLT